MNLSETIKKMGQPLEERAKFTDKQIKMAIGVASDPRYKKGNMTGAVQAIEKIAKGLSDHPQVHAVLRRQNEEVELEEANSARTSERFQSAEAELAAYAKKSGGADKKDFMDVAKMLGQIGRLNILQSGQVLARLNRKLSDMDTDPRDKVYSILKQKGLMESLQEAPEDNEPASPDEASMAKTQLEFIEYAAEEIMEHIESGKRFPEWMQNKLSAAHEAIEGLHSALGDHGEDEEELDEDFYNVVYRDKKGKVQGEKEFDTKSAAEKYAKLGNSRDKVGGKYTVTLVRDGGMGRRNEEVELDEGAVSASTVEKEIRNNGGKDIKKGDKEITFTMGSSKKTVPVDRGFVKDRDYMKLQKMFEEVELDELKKYDKNADFRVLNRLSQKQKTGNLTPAEKKQMDNAKARLRNHGFMEEVELEEKYSWNDVNDALTKANYMRGKPAEIMKVANKFDYKSGTDKKFSLTDVKKNLSAAGIDGARQHNVMKHMKEEVDINEAFESLFEEPKLSLEDTLQAIWEGKLDKVNKKALKKDFDDRKDKDIDNDGDVDDSDEYLHKRRQATSKAMEKDSDKAEKQQEKEVSDKEDEKKDAKVGKSGKQTKVDVNPSLDEEKGEEMTSAEMEKRDEIMKSLEKKKDEFVKKYGDRAKEVMARTAIKMAKKHA